MPKWQNVKIITIFNELQQFSLFFKYTSGRRLQIKSLARLFTLESADAVEVEKCSQQKLVKVALLGRTNVGKSTLINQILKVNVCDVSKKFHTTLFPVKAALTVENTQIIFIDTPGIISTSEASRLSIKKSVVSWKENAVKNADVIAIIEEATYLRQSMTFDNLVLKLMQNLPEDKTLVLIINKIDLLKEKSFLLKIVGWLKSDEILKKLNFKNIFFISALKDDGVRDITSFLLEEAKESSWILQESQVCDLPLDILIKNMVRAKMLNLLPHVIPYQFEYKILVLEENTYGEMYCDVLVKSPKTKFIHMITVDKKKSLKGATKKIESDIYKILKKTVKVNILFKEKKKENKKLK